MNSGKADCSDLTPIKDFNDVLKQMYTHLASGCILKMDPLELEKRWETDIFGVGKDVTPTPTNQMFMYKPLGSPKDDFYLFIIDIPYGRRCEVSLIDAAMKSGRQLFPGGKFPEILPPPKLDTLIPYGSHSPAPFPETRKPLMEESNIINNSVYYWGVDGIQSSPVITVTVMKHLPVSIEYDEAPLSLLHAKK